MSRNYEAEVQQEFMENPNKFGAPTFEEFKRNPEKYVGKSGHHDTFASIDRGSKNLARYVKRHKYELLGYRTEKLEEIERIASENNITLKDFTAECVPLGGGKCDILVRFVSPEGKYRRTQVP
jgi:hypothetical protein